MSSYTLFARLSNLEGDASDLQTAVDALSTNKQEKLTTIADDSGAKAWLVGNEVKGLAADASVNIICHTNAQSVINSYARKNSLRRGIGSGSIGDGC